MTPSNSNDNRVLVVQESKKTHNTESGFRPEVMKELQGMFRELTNKKYVIKYVSFVSEVLQDDKKPVKKQIKQYKSNFVKELTRFDPKYIIPLGATITGVLTGKPKFKDWVGRIIKKGNFRLIPIYHPNYAIKMKSRKREYETQCRIVVKQIMNSDGAAKKTKYKLFTDQYEIVNCISWLMNEKSMYFQAFDWETTSLIPEEGEITCMSISYEHGQGFCFYAPGEFKDGSMIGEQVKEWLESNIQKIAQNAKFEVKWAMHHLGVEPKNIVGDTKLMHHLIDENVSHRLTDLAFQYTDMGGYDTPMIEFLEEGNKHHDAKPKFMLPYSAGDSDCTRRLYFIFKPIIEKTGLEWLEKNIVMPAMYTLARIEERGMKIDFKRIDYVEKKINKGIKVIRQKIDMYSEVIKTVKHFKAQGKSYKNLEEINLDSPVQVKYLLFEACKLPVLTFTKTNQPSTDKTVLEQLANKHIVVKSIVEMRDFQHQLIEIEEIRRRRSKKDTIFSDLIQDFVVTGRLSSRSPNLQNMGGKSLVKSAFVSRFKNGVLGQVDFDQLELRLIASETGDPIYIGIFRRKLDPHLTTATELYDKKPKEVIKDERDKAKRVNFGVVFGITEHGLSKQINVTEKEAKNLLDKYWLKFKGVRHWMRKVGIFLQKHLYVKNRFGRRRHLPDITSNKSWVVDSALRQGPNFEIQSLGADITMWAMVQMDRFLMGSKLKSMVIGQIHDSIMMDIHPKEIETVNEIREYVMTQLLMETFPFLKVELTTSFETGSNWLDLKKYTGD